LCGGWRAHRRDSLLAISDAEPAEARRDLSTPLEQLSDTQRLPIVHVKPQRLFVPETTKLTGLAEPAINVGVHRRLTALLATKIRGTA
jgi:RNA polymerase sigma-70 factor (ECF subfamily)